MPRVKRFEELPAWLQDRLRRDWEGLHRGTAERPSAYEAVPPIRDPEYRVYRIGDSGWWAVDAGTGGVTIEREGESHAYGDLPEGELKALVDADGRACRDAEHVELLYSIIRGHGVDPMALGRVMARMEGWTDAQRVLDLTELLYDGVTYGDWPIG